MMEKKKKKKFALFLFIFTFIGGWLFDKFIDKIIDSIIGKPVDDVLEYAFDKTDIALKFSYDAMNEYLKRNTLKLNVI